MSRIQNFFILIFLIPIAYLLVWPVPINPIAWNPSPNRGFTGELAPNNVLSKALRLDIADGVGPEDVLLDSAGNMYASLQDGRIIRMDPYGKNRETLVNTGGRPLGMRFDQSNNLIVADAFKGLLMIPHKDLSRKKINNNDINVLSNGANGVPFRFTNALDISRDGRIFFTDSSYRFDQHHYQEDALEHRPNGRLLIYNPEKNETNVVLEDLYYPNGVALSEDESFLLINETWEYRVIRFWLTGPDRGKIEIILDGLPAFPDGISRGSDGIFWVALISPRSPIIDKLSGYPFLRKVVARLPRFLIPDAIPYAAVVGINGEGKIVYNFQDADATKIRSISSVNEYKGMLYLGSLKDSALGQMDISDLIVR